MIRPGPGIELTLKQCPRCGDDKWRAHFNPAKAVGHCKRNGCVFSERDMEPDLIAELKPYMRSPDVRPVSSMAAAVNHEWYKALEGPSFMKGWSTDWQCPEGRLAADYAMRRRVPDDLLESGQVGFFTVPASHHKRFRLAFLVREGSGRPVFWTARALRDDRRPKYLTSGRSEGAWPASSVVWGLENVQPGGTALICEGVLSALPIGGVAVFGNSISPVQAQLIAARRPAKAVILREKGITQGHAESQARKLMRHGIECSVAPLGELDTGDDPSVLEAALGAAERVAW